MIFAHTHLGKRQQYTRFERSKYIPLLSSHRAWRRRLSFIIHIEGGTSPKSGIGDFLRLVGLAASAI